MKTSPLESLMHHSFPVFVLICHDQQCQKLFWDFQKLATKCILLSSWANSSTCAAINCFDSITCFFWLSRRYYKCLATLDSCFDGAIFFGGCYHFGSLVLFGGCYRFCLFLEVLKTLAEPHCVKLLNMHPHKIMFCLFGCLFLSKRKYVYIILLFAILI